MASLDTAPKISPTNPATSVFGHDLLASVVVFLVALPLCMGIAIASNMPIAAGLVTGIIGGIVVGFLAGSPLQVSGPAAGLAVLVWQLVEKFGIPMVGVIVFFAGIIQILAGVFKLGQWFRAVSPAVIHGMLAGIGILILASQFHVMFDGAPLGSGIANLLGMPATVANAIAGGGAPLSAGLIGVLTIAAIFGWASLAPKSLKVIPAPLVGVAVGMLAAAFLSPEGIKYVVVPEKIFENLRSGATLPSFESLLRIFDPAVLIGAISVAFIASAETLLCATAVDAMHSGPRTKYDRELSAQGIGNALCGLLGGLPMTGVIVRSGANVEAGAKTRASAILHGVWLLMFVVLIPWTLGYIPMAALAAVLVYTGYKLAYPKIVPALLKYGKAEVFIYAVTIATIVSTDLLKGVVTGLVLSLGKLLYAFSHLEVRKDEDVSQNRIDLHFDGSATLVRLPILARALEALTPGSDVHVHLGELDYVDHACLDLLTNWEKQHMATGGTLTMDWETLEGKYHERHGTGPNNGKSA
ncbi:MAG: SulP family inorganic anion transporter [Hyphomicrobium sp.]|nr:SulP family inorganic anion transporter [Hyphomicrobium sp.]